MNSTTGFPLCAPIEITIDGGGGEGPILPGDLPESTKAQLGTGVITGGRVDIDEGAGGTTFDVSAGSGVIYYNNTLTEVTWTQQNSLPHTGVGELTWVYVDANSQIQTTTTTPDNITYRQYVFLGVIYHPNLPQISSIIPTNVSLSNLANQIRELSVAIGEINTGGNIISASTTNEMNFLKSSGSMYAYSANYNNTEQDPHVLQLTPLDTLINDFIYFMQDGSRSTTPLTLLISNILDDGTPYPGSTYGNGRWGAHRVYVTRKNSLVVLPAQEDFNNRNNTIDNINEGNFVVSPLLEAGALLLGYILMKGSATDTSDGTDVEFLQASRFGAGVSSASSGSDTLQSVYDNTMAPPNIVIDTVKGAVGFRAPAGTPEQTVLACSNEDQGASYTFYVTGQGNVECNTHTSDTLQTNKPITVGYGTATDWEVPNTRASTPGQVLTDVNGDGIASWQTPGGGPPTTPSSYFSTEFVHPGSLLTNQLTNFKYSVGIAGSGQFTTISVANVGYNSFVNYVGATISGQSLTGAAVRDFTVYVNVYNVTKSPPISLAFSDFNLPNTSEWKVVETCIIQFPINNGSAKYYDTSKVNVTNGNSVGSLDPTWEETDNFICIASATSTAWSTQPFDTTISVDWSAI
jgi:hypothetical protein